MEPQTRLALLANALEERAAEYPGLVVCEPLQLPVRRTRQLHVYLTTPGGREVPRSELVMELDSGTAYREEVFRSSAGTRTEEYWDPVRFDLTDGYRLAVPSSPVAPPGAVSTEMRAFEGPEDAADALVAFLEGGLDEAIAQDEPE